MKESARLLFGIFLYTASFVIPAAWAAMLLGLLPKPPYAASGYAGVVLAILVGGGCTYWLLGTRLWKWVETGEWKTGHHPV